MLRVPFYVCVTRSNFSLGISGAGLDMILESYFFSSSFFSSSFFSSYCFFTSSYFMTVVAPVDEGIKGDLPKTGTANLKFRVGAETY